MRHRDLASLCALAAAIGLASPACRAVSGQDAAFPPSTSETNGWTAPRTPWGEPDLQGIWQTRYATNTPLERPAAFGAREFLTDEEVAQRSRAEQQDLERRIAGADFQELGRPDPSKSPIAGNEYNTFWHDTGGARRVGRRTSMIVGPDGRIPLKPELEKKQAYRAEIVSSRPPDGFVNNSWMDRDTGERCLTDGVPGEMWIGTGPNLVIQGPGYVAILHEQFRDRRLIPTDGRSHGKVRGWLGNSVGRWEGPTLVVETTNFADQTHQAFAQVWREPTETMHLVERYTRVAADTLEYQMTLSDPAKFTKPWTAVATSPIQTPNPKFFEFACHEGNYAMVHMLSEARNLEKDAARSGGTRSR
jgi:hypothetical protein